MRFFANKLRCLRFTCIVFVIPYAALTLPNISRRIWKFAIRSIFGENTKNMEQKTWKNWSLANGCEFLTNSWECLRISCEPCESILIKWPNFLWIFTECCEPCEWPYERWECSRTLCEWSDCTIRQSIRNVRKGFVSILILLRYS